jgi:transglutaminase/protease-like cytokinesis protein 3
MKIFFIPFLLLVFLAAPAQRTSNPYAAIDSRVKKIKASTPDSLVAKLTSIYHTDKEKVRAIFSWIADNIAYDVDGYHNSAFIYSDLRSPAASTDHATVEQDYEGKIVQKVFQEKKAICDGYSRLFKALCDQAGIKCVIISGYIRWWSDSIGLATMKGHAWNAVFVENQWRLIDVTWASGYSDHNVTAFTKSFNDFFFFTDPIQFFNDHFPKDKNWSLLPNTPSLDQFYHFPFFYPALYKANITSVQPLTGVIEVKNPQRSFDLELGVKKEVESFFVLESSYVDTTTEAHPFDQDYHVENGRLNCHYQVHSPATDRIDIYLNYELILSYSLRVF